MHKPRLVFWIIFTSCLIIGAAAGLASPARAESLKQEATPAAPATSFSGSETCAICHKELHESWEDTLHAHAFSSPIFQRDWTELGSQTACLACHTTGFNPVDGTYIQEGVSCESCHGPMVAGHPEYPMTVKADATLCATCHKNTTDEWQASQHAAAGIQCESCHDPHSQSAKAETVTELCTNCHKDSESFTHGTHAQAGLECSNCHMYSEPRTASPIGGLIATGHTFSVGSDACIGCHQDTVHSRDEIVKLTGEIQKIDTTDLAAMEKLITDQESQIDSLEQDSQVRLYTGLMQGAIIGLLTGAVGAWVVSQRVKVVEEAENE
jgi:predicted CXXCH cytochrome family protein